MASKKAVNKTQTVLYVLIILGFVAVLNYLSTRFFKRLDVTENKEYSISNATKGMLQDVNDIVNIKVYFSQDLPPHLKTLESGVSDLLSEFKAYSGGNLRITFEDPSKDEETKQKVRALGIPEIRLQTFERDKAQVMNGFMGMAVLYADKKEVLPVVQDLRNLEYDLAQAVMKVLRSEVPKIGVLKTDTMPYLPPNIQQQMQARDQTEEKYSPIFQNLKENYDVETVDISSGQEISPDIKTLIIPGGGPKSFTERKLFEIDQYFMNGGNLIVLVDAIKVDFQQGVMGTTQRPRIMDLLDHYGVQVREELVLDASCGQVQVPQQVGNFQMNVPVSYPYFVRVGQDGFNQDNPAVSGLAEVLLPWVSPLRLTVESDTSLPVSGTVLMHSSERSWTESDNFNLNPQQDWGQVLQANAEQLQQHPLGAYLNGDFVSYFKGKTVPPVKEESEDALSQIQLSPQDQDRQIMEGNTSRHLVVVGDADFLSQQNAAPGNVTWLLNVVDWLTLDENLIQIRSRALADRTLSADQLEEGSSMPTVIRMVNVVLMPALIILVGLIIYFVRRRKVDTAPATATAKNTGVGNDSAKTEGKE